MSWDDIFKRAEKPAGPPKLEPGTYAARVVEARFAPTRAGKPRMSWKLQAGQAGTAWMGHNMPDEDTSSGALWFMRRTLEAFRITPAMLDADTESAIQTALGQIWRIEVKLSKDGEWTNVTLIDELPRDHPLGPCEPPSEPEPAEEIPKEQRESWEPF